MMDPATLGAVVLLPVVHRSSFGDPDWREQFCREVEARNAMASAPPPRTRPLIVARRPEGRP
jgi:hypothetical protein